MCGKSKGGKGNEKETWCLNDKVQDKIKRKKDAFKEWYTLGDAPKKESYKKAKKGRKGG